MPSDWRINSIKNLTKVLEDNTRTVLALINSTNNIFIEEKKCMSSTEIAYGKPNMIKVGWAQTFLSNFSDWYERLEITT